MAASTSIQFTHNQRIFKLTVTQTNVSIANNTSDLNWSVQISNSPATGANYHDSYVKAIVNGTTVVNLTKTWDAKVFPAADGTKSGTITGVQHDTLGNKTVSLYIEGYSWQYSTQTKSGSLTLDQIARRSQPSVSASSCTLTNSVTIYTNRASGSGFTHTIGIYDGSTIVQSWTDVTDSVSWTPSIANYANRITTSDRKTFTIKCTTYNSGASIGDPLSCNITLIVPDNATTKPSASITLAKGDGVVPSGWNCYVQGKSRLYVTVTGTQAYDAAIKSYSSTALGVTRTATQNSAFSYTTDTITTSGTVTVTGYVTDARGHSSPSASNSVTVVAYSVPTITSAAVERCLVDGTSSESGTYVKITFYGTISPVNNNNSKNFRVGFRTKGSTGSYTYKTWTDAYTKSINNTVLTGDGWSGAFSASSSYEIIFEAWDTFTSSSHVAVTKIIGTEFDLIHFNTNGKAIAFGKKSEATGSNSLFEVGIPAILTSLREMTLESAGGYKLSSVGHRYHQRTNSDYWAVANNAGSWTYAIYPETGNLNITGDIATWNKGGSTEGNKIILVPYIKGTSIGVSGSDDDAYFQAYIKWLCTTYPNKSHYMFIGRVGPNSQGIALTHIYDTSTTSGGLPQYCDLIYFGIDRTRQYWTDAYTFKGGYSNSCGYGFGTNSVLRTKCYSLETIIGSLNDGWCHFQTTAPAFHMNKALYVQGNLYGGSNYNKKLPFEDQFKTYSGGSSPTWYLKQLCDNYWIEWCQYAWTGKINSGWSNVYKSGDIALPDFRWSFTSTPWVFYTVHAQSGAAYSAWVVSGNTPPTATNPGKVLLCRGPSEANNRTYYINILAIGPR